MRKSNFSITFLRAVSAALKNFTIETKRLGICRSLQTMIQSKDRYKNDDAYDFIAVFSKGWRHHSGNVWYPIPVCENDLENLWEGESLRYRLDLIKYLTEQVDAHIAERTKKNKTTKY